MKRALFLLAVLVVSPLHAAPKAQPLTGEELREFLGPVSPDAFRWSKYTLIDFELYNGEAKPPLSGHVGFYLGGHPDFKPPAGSARVRGKLGRYDVVWYRAAGENGAIRQDTLVRLGDYWRVDLRVTAKTQQDIDRIISLLSQLPLLSRPPKSPFGAQPAPHRW